MAHRTGRRPASRAGVEVFSRLSRHRLPTTVLAGVVAAIPARAAAPALVPAAAPVAASAGPVFTVVNNVPATTARRPAGSPAFVYLEGLALVAGPEPDKPRVGPP